MYSHVVPLFTETTLGKTTTTDERLALVFRESLRALEQQAARRDDLRNRAGGLMTAAAIATAFLGGQSLDGATSFAGSTWLAVLAFAWIIGLSLYVLTPRRGWILGTSAGDLIAEYLEGEMERTVDDMHRELALHFEDDIQANARSLDRFTVAVQVSGLLLVFEIAAWLIDLRGRM